MDTKLLKAAASFALQYKRVHGEALSVASLVAGIGAQEKVDKACLRALEDPVLDKATKDFASALGLVFSVVPSPTLLPQESVVNHATSNVLPETPIKPVASLSGVQAGRTSLDVPGEKATAKQWQMILACAYEVAGPMAEVWIEQAKASGPSTLKEAILASKQSMGAFGSDFAKALRHHLIDKS